LAAVLSRWKRVITGVNPVGFGVESEGSHIGAGGGHFGASLGLQKIRHRHGGQDANNSHDYQQFNQCECTQ
jgi:hypothetical protein